MKKFSIHFGKTFGLLLFLLMLTGSGLQAQYRNGANDFWSRVRFGGGLGIGFGNDSFNAGIAPSALYQVSPEFATGMGLSFNYAKFGDAKFTAYGGSAITLFNPIPALQLSGEFEQLRVHRDFGFTGPGATEDYWLPALFFGLGYSSGPVTVGIRYDVLYDENKSIYADPWMPFVRVYF